MKMRQISAHSLLLLLLLVLVVASSTTAFCVVPFVTSRTTSTASTTASSASSSRLYAKKSKNSRTASKGGFGKVTEEQQTVEKQAKSVPTGSSVQASSPPPPEAPTSASSSSSLLQSVAGGSSAVPQQKELPAEERAARILREQYGMKTLGEQQFSAKQQEVTQERNMKLQEWKKKADDSSTNEDEFDVMTMLPAPLLKGIDTFLKLGLAVTSILFISAGIGITLEAWSKTSGQAIDPNLDKFIVETIEPNFTAGLFVLLGFSISLGLFAAAQLVSAGAVYKEDK